MGPAEKRPVLPRYECLENMDDGEFVEADDSSIGGGGPAVIPCNWLQHFENVVDPDHVPVLHGSFSGPQFTDVMASMPEVRFDKIPRGIGRMRSKFNGKFWWDMTEQEHQQFPRDYESQVGQGPMTVHSEEHFGQSDRGILMIRRMLGDQLEAMEAGRDPIGISFDTSAAPVEFEAGNYIREG